MLSILDPSPVLAEAYNCRENDGRECDLREMDPMTWNESDKSPNLL